jgi:amino-acid N-acetyltransferase
MVQSEGLPADGIAENLDNFLLIRGGDGRLLGVAGAEVYERQALLRSVCVARSERGKSLGATLTGAVVSLVQSYGCTEIYLLTTTADKYFERHGFSRIDRSRVTGPVLESVEFKSACPASAVVMKRDLTACCC